MRALSVHQPYASLIAAGLKKVELRSWDTVYRGDLLICSTRRKDNPFDVLTAEALIECSTHGIDFDRMGAGVTICIATLTDVAIATPVDLALSMVRPTGYLYAWRLANIRCVVEKPVLGRLGIFWVDDKIIELRTKEHDKIIRRVF